MRVEYKFLVPDQDLQKLRAAIAPFMELDPYVGESGEYTVRSIYFDTPSLEYYRDKIEGLRVRRKLRIRGYGVLQDAHPIFLEIKKKYERAVVKNRAPLDFANLAKLMQTRDADRYLTSGNNGEWARNARRFLYHIVKRSLRPVVLVTYDREPFLCKFDKNTRVTIDKRLRFIDYPDLDDLFTEDGARPAMNRHFILEAKFNHKFPNWLLSIVTQHGWKWLALSKYTICLDAMDADSVLKRSVPLAFANYRT